MIPAGLAAALAAFDEAALILLANKGLVRRAARDVEAGLAVVQEGSADAVTVECDGDTVRLDRRGPSFASCTCPAPGVCRHRLAAVLAVQTQAMPDPAEKEGLGVASDIAALPLEALSKWAGKAAWRAACELAAAGAEVAPDGGGFTVIFPDEGFPVRILPGQGLDGMVSKATAAARKTFHAAAWLVARAHLGLGAPPDSEAPAGATTEVPGAMPGFLDTVTETLEDVVRLGFNLAPESLEERLFLLSVSSRADSFSRLAAMLRTLSAHVRSRRRRDFTFDPDGCLELLADTFLLVSALRGVDEFTSAERRDALFGRARRDYIATAALELTGCGAEIWTTPAGARGVTGYFYDASSDRWLTASLARGANQDPGFDPVHAYEKESLWSGKTVHELCHAEVKLRKAQASDDGRLSAASGVMIASLGKRTVADTWPCLFDHWDRLATRLNSRISDGRAEPVLLRPAAMARPAFDDLTQILTWPLRDSEGRWLAVSLEHGRDRAALVEALQTVAESGWSGTIMALASIDGRDFRLRPVALIDEDTGYNLGLDDLRPLMLGSWAQKTTLLMRDMKAALGHTPKTFVSGPSSRASQLVHAAWQSVLNALEIGPRHALAIDCSEMERHAKDLHNAGFPTLAESIALTARADARGAPFSLLKAASALTLARRLMIRLPYLRGN